MYFYGPTNRKVVVGFFLVLFCFFFFLVNFMFEELEEFSKEEAFVRRNLMFPLEI